MGLPIFRFTLKHLLQADDIQFTNNSFATSLTGWDQITSGGINFSFSAPSSARASGASSDTAAIGQICQVNSSAGWPAGTYTIQIKATNTSTGGSAPLTTALNVYGSDTGAALDDFISHIGDGTWNVGAGPITREVTFTTTQYYQKLFFKFVKQGPSGGYNVNFAIDFIQLIRVQNATNDLQVSEPDGWKGAKLKLERHPEFHSLVEYFEGGFIHYGENNVDIGGADFIRTVENVYGFDAQIIEEIDVSFDSSIYENIFTGLKDLTTIEEIQDNKIEVATIPSSLWTTFISRLDTPVDLRSTTDLDGNPVNPVEPIDINLPAQKIRKNFYGYVSEGFEFPDWASQSAGDYLQFGMDKIPLDEFNDDEDGEEGYIWQPISDNPVLPQFTFYAKYFGDYTFDIRYEMSLWSGVLYGSMQFGIFPDPPTDILKMYIQVNNETPIELTEVNHASFKSTSYSFRGTFTLKETDTVRIYGDYLQDLVNPQHVVLFGQGKNDFSGGSFPSVPSGVSIPAYIRITANTSLESSDAKGFYLHDVFAGIVERLVGSNVFYSDVMGRTDTNMRAYGSNGCYSGFALIKGLQLRGYLLEDKIFSISFNQAWKGANPIFNLGLRRDNNGDFIRIERKSAEYDPTSVSVNIENVRTISREYDTSRIFNAIQVGYNKWESENISGIDDVQTKREFSTIVRSVKNKLNITSDFIAASYAIEMTRRQSIKESKDYKYDNDTFIIALNSDDVSPDRYRPETDENFNSIAGLLNSDTRYNTVLSPVRNLLRWGNYWNGCLQKYQTSTIKFVSGEGNYDMVSDYSCSTGLQCLAVICDPISEKGDISLAAYGGVLGYIHLPMLYTVEIINFSWDDYVMIRNNPTLAIAVSQSDTNLKRFFIKDLTYEICKSKCKIVMWPYEDAPIRVIDTNPPEL